VWALAARSVLVVVLSGGACVRRIWLLLWLLLPAVAMSGVSHHWKSSSSPL